MVMELPLPKFMGVDKMVDPSTNDTQSRTNSEQEREPLVLIDFCELSYRIRSHVQSRLMNPKV